MSNFVPGWYTDIWSSERSPPAQGSCMDQPPTSFESHYNFNELHNNEHKTEFTTSKKQKTSYSRWFGHRFVLREHRLPARVTPFSSPGHWRTVLSTKICYFVQVQNSTFPLFSFTEKCKKHDPTTFRYGVIPFLISVPV